MNAIGEFNSKIFAAGAIFMAFAAFAPISVFAYDLSVTKAEVYNIKDNTAIIGWTTPNAKTSGMVYIGKSTDKMDRLARHTSASYSHELKVDSIDKGCTYFYKIIAVGQDNSFLETFIRSFSTSQMADTVRPEILDMEASYSGYEAAVIRWMTSEPTTTVIQTGASLDKMSKKIYLWNYNIEHDAIIYGLGDNMTNYVRLTVTDKGGNTASKTIIVSPSGSAASTTLKITGITPAYADLSMISARTAKIYFKTNMPAKSRICYGTNPSYITKLIDVSSYRVTGHEAVIDNLIPRTTYFYKIEAYDSLYQKRVLSDVMSFNTGDLKVRYASGSLVRGSDGKVYIIYKDTKAWITNPEVFLGLGFKGEWVQDIPDSTLKDYEEIKKVDSANRHPSGSLIKYANSATVYLIEGNAKRPIGSPEAFLNNGFRWDRIMPATKYDSFVTGQYIS